MNDSIMVKSGRLGNRTAMPNLTEDELGYQKDEKALYIGDSKNNVRLCGANDVPGMNDKIANITDEIADINDKITNMTDEISDNDTEIGEFKEEIGKIKTDIAKLNEAISSIYSRLDALTAPSE